MLHNQKPVSKLQKQLQYHYKLNIRCLQCSRSLKLAFLITEPNQLICCYTFFQDIRILLLFGPKQQAKTQQTSDLETPSAINHHPVFSPEIISKIQIQMQATASHDKKHRPQASSRHKTKAYLSKEFEDFKQRIQQFEDKNEEIINRIRDAYNYKKKALQNGQIYQHTTQRNPHFQYSLGPSTKQIMNQPQETNHPVNLMRNSSEFSPNNKRIAEELAELYHETSSLKQEHVQQKMQALPLESIVLRPHYSTNSPMQISQPSKLEQTNKNFMRNTQMMNLKTEQTDDDIDHHHQERNYHETPYSMIKSRGHHYYEEKINHLEAKLNELAFQNKELMEYADAKEEELLKYRNLETKFKSYVNSAKKIIQGELQLFQEDYVCLKFNEMSKHVKKCEIKMKKLIMTVKDAIEDREANRVIHNSKVRRISSKIMSKKASMSSLQLKEQSFDGKDKVDESRNRSASRFNNSKQKSELQIKTDFQNIAVGYEQMIKSKIEENQNLEKRMRDLVDQKKEYEEKLKRIEKMGQEKDKKIESLLAQKNRDVENGLSKKKIEELSAEIERLQQELTERDEKEQKLKESFEKLRKQQQNEYQSKLQALNTAHNSTILTLQTKIKEIEKNSSQKFTEMTKIRQQFADSQRKLMQKQCEFFTLSGKLKKLQSQCSMKDDKLKEFEELLLKKSENSELLDRSISVDNSIMLKNDLKSLQDRLRNAEYQLEEKTITIYQLQSTKNDSDRTCKMLQQQIVNLTSQIQNLQDQILEQSQQLQKAKQQENNRYFNCQMEAKEELAEDYEQKLMELTEQRDEIMQQNSNLNEQIKKLKHENMQTRREVIKLISQCSFNKAELQNWQTKHEKYKEEKQQLRKKISELELSLEQNYKDHIGELQQYIIENHNLKDVIHELQLKSRKISLQSLQNQEDSVVHSYHFHNKTQNSEAYVGKTIKQTEESMLNLKNRISKVESEFQIKITTERSNPICESIEQHTVKAPGFREVSQQEQNHSLTHDLNVRVVESLNTEVNQGMYEQMIFHLKEQLNKSKENQSHLTSIMHQLFDNIKSKDEQSKKMFEQIYEKQRVIIELKDLIEMKEAANNIRQSKEEQLIKETHMSFKLSVDLSEDMNEAMELSYLSNISDVFKRDELLQEKIRTGKTSREEQIKLYSKTSAYIKSLKNTIEMKEKRIKLLQKQLSSLKSQENSRWSGKDKEKSSSNGANCSEQSAAVDDIQECDEYKDYDSVQLDTRRSKYHQLVKILQHEKNLVVEENKMLLKQIDVLQEEIERAEDQQNSLMRIKQLYKEQIKRLIDKNERQSKDLEELTKKLEIGSEAGEIYHNMEAIKQLFIKLISTFAYIQDHTVKQGKRQEKKKQLEEYVKFMCSLLELQPSIRDKLISSLRK